MLTRPANKFCGRLRMANSEKIEPGHFDNNPCCLSEIKAPTLINPMFKHRKAVGCSLTLKLSRNKWLSGKLTPHVTQAAKESQLLLWQHMTLGDFLQKTKEQNSQPGQAFEFSTSFYEITVSSVLVMVNIDAKLGDKLLGMSIRACY